MQTLQIRGRFLTRALGTALVLGTLAAPLKAQTNVAPPDGWTKSGIGGNIVYSQPESGSRIAVQKLAPLGGETGDWFEAQVKRDSRARGEMVSPGTLKIVNGRYLRGRIFRADQGLQTVIYYGYAVGGQGRLILYVAPSSALKQEAATFSQLTKALYAADMSGKAAPVRGGSAPVGQVAQSGASTRDSATKSNPTTSPAATRDKRKVGEFWGVFLNETYTTGVGGMMVLVYEPVLVTRNGWARRNAELPPGDVLTRGDKAAHPRDWGRWTRSGAKLVVRWSAKDSDELKISFKSPPARPGQTLSGSYSSLSGGGNTALGGDIMTFSSNSYTFTSNGRFAAARSGGGMSSSFTAVANSNKGGRYQLDGHVLTLKFNGGRVVRQLFYFYPDDKGQHRVLGIGDSAFIVDD